MSGPTLPDPAPANATLDVLFQAVNRNDAPGLVVGLARHGRTFYRRGFGLASVEAGVANTPWTRMRIGSTSKHFTCLAVLLLAEDGLLDADASVRRYLPELPALAGEPTLRQLMTHTGGYRDYLDLSFLAGGMAIKPPGLALQAQMRQSDVNFLPGEKMMYCNGGYHLLSLVIERVSGLRFEDFLRQRIFAPLAMRDTVSVPSDFEIHRGLATLHLPAPNGGWRRGIFPTEEVRGEGGMVSSVDDMLVWLAHLRSPDKKVGSAETWRQMLSTATLNNGLPSPYALGLMRHDYRGLEVIHHAGSVIGGSCQMLTVPSQALDIIIISNGAPLSPVEQAWRIIDSWAEPGLLSPPARKAAAADHAPMLGTRYFAVGSGLAFGFAEGPEGGLGLSFLNGPPMPLKQQGLVLRLGFEDIAMGPLSLAAATLARTGQQPPASLELAEAGQAERYERLPATPPALAEVAALLVGRYHSPDLDAVAEIRFESQGPDHGEALLMQVIAAYGSHTMALEAWSDQVFGWQISGTHTPQRGVLSVERDAQGRLVAVHMNTPRTRRLRFERLKED
jgi:D-aminopeptidase